MMGKKNLKANEFRRSKMTQAIPGKEQMRLNQVWFQLSRDHQVGVIQLMAQLVLKLVVAQIEANGKEVRDEQDPG